MTEGLDIGQQVVALAGPNCLRNLADALSQHGHRSEPLLRSGRLMFLTAPGFLAQIATGEDPLARTALRRNGPMLRWVSDWSWAYGEAADRRALLEHQQRVHDYVRGLTALSVCTLRCQKLERSALLAIVADHRRALADKSKLSA
jgi:MEDS: MEthanogen/methylotroph, DcmR Sensory domain